MELWLRLANMMEGPEKENLVKELLLSVVFSLSSIRISTLKSELGTSSNFTLSLLSPLREEIFLMSSFAQLFG